MAAKEAAADRTMDWPSTGEADWEALYAVANNSKMFVRLNSSASNGQFDLTTELLRTEGGVGHGRNHVKRGGIWIGANALAWTAGMPLIFLAAGLPSPHTSALAIGAFVMITVAVAGAVVGAIEGAFLRLLLRPAG